MQINGKNIDKRIITLLNTRNITSESELKSFLFPNKNDFLDPFKLSGIKNAITRIESAIENKEKIVIYGDYDCDGISSSVMFYLYLKSRGNEPRVFIPERFSDGYGISEKTIHEIAENLFPDLIITVDCGISAIEEINLIKDLGIDIIVTDHHQPAQKLPNCIIVNPKLPNQEYQFDGLSGAGVVFKIIHAMSGLEEAMKYLDICAISTIGDIVPLVNENRLISYFGLKMLNQPNARPFVKHIKKKLGLEQITSTDLSFKIVPRINASGRMNTSFKGFQYFISKEKTQLDELFEQIEQDNNDRLHASNEAFSYINSNLQECDFNNKPAIFIYEPKIHLGIIGIVASRLCNMYNRPVFIFTDSEDGNLKASVRSISGINIFDIMSKERNLLVDIGGHELAGGLTIIRDNLKIFEDRMQKSLKSNFSEEIYIPKFEYDFEIFEEDFSINFVDQLKLLEPFGHMNKKPTLMFKGNNLDYVQLKSFKHYRLLTKSKKEILSFFGNKYWFCYENCTDLQMNVELDTTSLYNRKKTRAILKNIIATPQASSDERVLFNIKSFFYKLQQKDALNLLKTSGKIPASNRTKQISENYNIIKNLLQNPYQTLVVADNFETYEKYKKEFNIRGDFLPNVCGRTMVVYNPLLLLDKNNLLLYKYLILPDGELFANQYSFLQKELFINTKQTRKKQKPLQRDSFAKCYRFICNLKTLSANNFVDLVYLIASKTKDFTLEEIAFCLCVSAELDFFKLTYTNDEISLSINTNPVKNDLNNSLIFKDMD